MYLFSGDPNMAPPRKPKRKPGRPPKINPELILTMCNALENNRTIGQACSQAGVTQRSHENYMAQHPGYADKIQQAITQGEQNTITQLRNRYGAINTTLNIELIDTICDTIRQGNYPTTAAVAQGVQPQNWSTWLTQGKIDIGVGRESIFSYLHGEVQKASAEAEISLLKRSDSYAEDGKKQWVQPITVMSRRFRERWSESTQVNVDVQVSGPDVAPKPRSVAEFTYRHYPERLTPAQKSELLEQGIVQPEELRQAIEPGEDTL
jgi:hypothetical protein